jgi:3-methyladenine DNA glycosylase AlkC
LQQIRPNKANKYNIKNKKSMAKSLNDVRQESVRVWAQAQKQWQHEQNKRVNFVFEEANRDNSQVTAAAAGASGVGGGGNPPGPRAVTISAQNAAVWYYDTV